MNQPQAMEKPKLPPKTKSIIESCLYVADVDRAAEWYGQVFGFPLIYHQEDRLRALRVGQEQVLLLFKEKASLSPRAIPGGVLPAHDGSGPAHIAFSLRTAEAEEWERHLNTHGIEVISRVDWGENGKSLYFRDLDNHVLELISGDYWQKITGSLEEMRSE